MTWLWPRPCRPAHQGVATNSGCVGVRNGRLDWLNLLPGTGRRRSMGLTAEEAAVSDDAGFSFEEFVRSRSPHLFKLALLLTGQNWAEAEDLLQIAMERAYRRRALLSPHRSPEPYVRQVLVNASIDRRRLLRRPGEQPLDSASPEPAAGDPRGDVSKTALPLARLGVTPR